jgi:hypothetical protein
MNKRNYPLSELNNWLNQVGEIKILLPKNPKLDQVAAASALADSLNKSGKKTQVLCPRSLTVEFSQVIGVDKINTAVEGRNFIINIDYPLKNIEKINWDDQEEKQVSLIIEPKSTAAPIEESLVSFKKSNGQIENLIALGFSSLEEVNQAVNDLNSNQAAGLTTLVNINLGQGDFFGQIKLIDEEALSFAEIISGIIEGLSLPMSVEAATNLLLGLQVATDSFSAPGIGPDTFEAAAFCLRAGGRLENQASLVNEDNGSQESFGKPKIYRGSGQ